MRAGIAQRLRRALISALLLACSCQFTVDGFTPSTADDGGTMPAQDGSPSADLANAADLYTPMPDLVPLPDKIGDACSGSCGGGLTCMPWVSDGYCSESCDSATTICPSGSTCVDIGGGSHYCLLNANGGNCSRPSLHCRDCSADVCAPSSFCGGC